MKSISHEPLATRWRVLNRPTWLRRSVAVCFFAAVNWMLLAPAEAFEELPLLFEHEDKIAHGAIFLALAWLVRWAVPARYGLGWQRFGVLAALALYAATIETFQPLVGGAGRQFEWLDMASNFTGIAAGWLLLGAMIADRYGKDMPSA
jgi:hypothetical protein